MSRLGQQGFFARKQSANVAAAKGVHSVRKRSATKRQQQQDVGHEGVITGRDALSLRSFIRLLQGLTLITEESPSLHSNQRYIAYIQKHLTPNHYTKNYNLIYNIP